MISGGMECHPTRCEAARLLIGEEQLPDGGQDSASRPRRGGLRLEALWLKHLPNAEGSHEHKYSDHDWAGDLRRFQPTFLTRVLGGR